MKLHFVLCTFLVFGLIPMLGTADTVVSTIIEPNDDAEEDITGPNAGNVRRTSSDLEIGNENGIEQWVGLRFQNLAIPAGSTINSASIKFTSTETDVGNLIIPIVGELSPNPLEFRDTTPLTGRPLTNSIISWDIDPWFPGDSGLNTTTPDLSIIVQEIVEQADWTSGNSMVFLFQNDPLDTSERLAVSFDGNPLAAAELTVDFTPPATGVVTSVEVIRGVQTGGSINDLHESDNLDYSVQRNPAQTTGVIELEVASTSSTEGPVRFEFTLEAAGFFRSTVIQSIQFYDFAVQDFIEVDSRNASRFGDSITVVSATGDLSRFVEPITGNVLTRVLYTSVSRRQAFSASIDQIHWSIE